MLLHAKYNDILILGYLNFLKMFPKFPTSNFGPQGLEDHTEIQDSKFEVQYLKFNI
jgi:hypothetical protein